LLLGYQGHCPGYFLEFFIFICLRCSLQVCGQNHRGRGKRTLKYLIKALHVIGVILYEPAILKRNKRWKALKSSSAAVKHIHRQQTVDVSQTYFRSVFYSGQMKLMQIDLW